MLFRQVLFVPTLILFVKDVTGAGQTGPHCYSCPHSEDPSICKNTVQCSASQVCSVQEVDGLHGDFYFWSGCEEQSVCSDLSGSSVFGKRAFTPFTGQRCLICCHADLCNNHCDGFTNLALHKPAYQSSVAYNGPPQLAVDGNKDKYYFNGSCIHAKFLLHSWWAVDLQQNYTITKVVMYNRNDAGIDGRMVHLDVLVSKANATLLAMNSAEFQKCGTYYGHSSDGNTVTFDCPRGIIGRWVRIQDTFNAQEYFHFCEIEVFGY